MAHPLLGGCDMQIQLNGTALELVEGDVTDQDTDAIVNAAHPDLLGGQGVDGAVHTKGGPEILAECEAIARDFAALESDRWPEE